MSKPTDKPEKAAKPDKGGGDKAKKGGEGKPAKKGAGVAVSEGRPSAVGAPVPRLFDRYKKEVVPALAQKFGRKNVHSLPKLQKIVVNMGVGKALMDKNRMQEAVEHLAVITGQRPQITKAKIAVSGFRLREGNEIGCRVTLRRARMYEFMDRLISIALPRIRDFRGINPNSFDGRGNYSFGLAEQLVFPEIDADKVNFTQGMDVTFVTSADTDDEAREFLKLMGMPFRDN